ncbi:hypothetical protein BCR34DRAFT_625062 [Clohesyomyces aquaticus]|uniref:Uncharacterized protein n=1 Tax=Clohesyomyces aquaticus TaxID=1231657 RepID=A0A1Y1ZKS8_9PLEO|nr:hypothetical protein BCR34DRAFT_625062 [Clohesyomyces aquaticus]
MVGPLNISLVQNQDVLISEYAGLTITVIGLAEGGVKQVTDFDVSSKICGDKSRYLGGLIQKSGMAMLENENKDVMRIWLSGLHDMSDEKMEEQSIDEVSIYTVWELLRIIDVHGSAQDQIDTVELDNEFARALALPCMIFDHAPGFAHVTKFLGYNYPGQIKERRTNGFKSKQRHLAPPEFVGKLSNSGRAGLKAVLHRNLWSSIGRILSSCRSCSCWDKSIGRYIAELVHISVFPLDETFSQTSINQLFERLDRFRYTYTPNCQKCEIIDWDHGVQKAISATKTYFHGLCMDCTDTSKPKRSDHHTDY